MDAIPLPLKEEGESLQNSVERLLDALGIEAKDELLDLERLELLRRKDSLNGSQVDELISLLGKYREIICQA